MTEEPSVYIPSNWYSKYLAQQRREREEFHERLPEMWAYLAEAGCRYLLAFYSGGNDQGGTDEILLWSAARDLDDVNDADDVRYMVTKQPDGVRDFPVAPYQGSGDEHLDLIMTLACFPADAEYQGYNNEPTVEGVVIFDAQAKSVRRVGTESQTEYVDVDEVW